MSLMRVAALAAVFVISTPAHVVLAQHGGHTMPTKPDTTKKKTSPKPAPSKPPAKKTMPSPPMPMGDSAEPMQHRMPREDEAMMGPLNIPMNRMGSGTTWIPDDVSLPSRHRTWRQWDIMAHGFVFAQYDTQSGPRGDEQLGSLNWIMLMATHELAGGHFQGRTMLSVDPATVTNKGYPLLLQSGETFDGEPLHDRQHPHDFFMELAVLYQRQLSDRIAWSVYAAPSGEPALGPVAFMHRPSAMDNPAAPLSHHWQDATHVSFGVLTAGLFTQRWQIEGSAFNGREPDEERWNLDPIRIDSYSGRITSNPGPHWSLSGGYGYLKSPEALHPDEPMHRVTASVLHGSRFRDHGQTSSALVWGMNRHGDTTPASHSVLLENETIFDRNNSAFGRIELVQKTPEDLALDETAFDTDRFNVGAIQLGYIREVVRLGWATLGVGAAGTVNFVPESLEETYGSRNPTGAFLFVRLRPFHLTSGGMKMQGMEKMQH